MTVDRNATGASQPFFVSWSTAQDPHRFWQQERMHFPTPISPLAFSLLQRTYPQGFLRGARDYFGLPYSDLQIRRINTYIYMSQEMQPGPGAQQGTALERLHEHGDHLTHYWHSEWLPLVRDHLTYWQARHDESTTKAELFQYLEQGLSQIVALWDIHYRLVLPLALAISQFEDLYTTLFPNTEPLAPHTLLQGFESKSQQRDLALWRLGRMARAIAEVSKLLATPIQASTMEALTQCAGGRVFLAELHTTLEEFGHLGVDASLITPPWRAEPARALQVIRRYMLDPEQDLPAKLSAYVNAREQAVKLASSRLPDDRRAEFERSLHAAQQATFLSEEHNYWIDQRILYHLRHALLEIGQRLAAAGQIQNENDVFYLTFDELSDAVAGDRSWGDTVKAAKEQMAYFATIDPPTTLGGPPPNFPANNPMQRAYMKFVGARPQPESNPMPTHTDTGTDTDIDTGIDTGIDTDIGTNSEALPETMTGHPASAGIVRGRVYVTKLVEDAFSMAPGAVLVTPTTSPDWTPLFANLTALITETGGIISHAAIVAREYGVPAIVGVPNATTRLRTGQQVELNGSTGLIRILN